MAIGNPTTLGTGESSSFVTTLASSSCVVPSNTLVIVPVAHSGSASIVDPTGVSDGTNSLTSAGAGVSRSATENVSLWYRFYTSGATLTFTASFSSSSLSGLVVLGVSNAVSVSPLDQYGTGSNFDANATSTTAGNCAQADELSLQVLMQSSVTAFSAWPSAGYTSIVNSIGDGSRSHRYAFAYKNGVTNGATETATATLPGSLDWVQLVATFKGATASSLPPGADAVRRTMVAVQRSSNY